MSTEIQTREQFQVALGHVKDLVKQDLSADEAKTTLTKAEALRAWASFDKRLSIDEKKEANRAMTRVVRMLMETADREQPVRYLGRGRGRSPGPVAWLRRELKWSNTKATSARRLVNEPELFDSIIESGVHWVSALTADTKKNPVVMLNRMSTWIAATNSMRLALAVTPQNLPRSLARIRRIQAWCKAYEAALIQRQAQQKETL